MRSSSSASPVRRYRTGAGNAPTTLSWTPPGYPDYAGYQTLHITNAGSRDVTLADNTDYRVILDEVINTATGGSFLKFTGGRNVVLIGGHLSVPLAYATTTLTAILNATDTTITAADTTGYPTAGSLVIRRETWSYTGKTATTFTGAAKGSEEGGGIPAPHPIGTSVYPIEFTRRGIGFFSQTGIVHVEGLLIDGADLTEGIDIFGIAGSTYQLQNLRIGPVAARDETTFYDNHPDCVQVLSGPDRLLIDRCTFLTDFQAVLLKGIDNGRATKAATIRHLNAKGTVTATTPGSTLIIDTDSAIVEASDVWVDPGFARSGNTVSPLDAAWGSGVYFGTPTTDFCPAGTAGASYVSPGYAA